MKPELSYLAHNLVEIDKYRVETCCVIGKCYYEQISSIVEGTFESVNICVLVFHMKRSLGQYSLFIVFK